MNSHKKQWIPINVISFLTNMYIFKKYGSF